MKYDLTRMVLVHATDGGDWAAVYAPEADVKDAPVLCVKQGHVSDVYEFIVEEVLGLTPQLAHLTSMMSGRKALFFPDLLGYVSFAEVDVR